MKETQANCLQVNDKDLRCGLLFMKRTLGMFVVLWTCLLSATAQEAESMFYLSNGEVRHACYYKPAGDGPFPVMIYNQATHKPAYEQGDAPFLALASFYVKNGFVLFLPGRPLLNVPNPEQKKPVEPVEMADQQLLRAYEGQNANIESAVVWLKTQSFADVNRLYMSGHSSGAIQTVLLAQKDLGIRGFIAFSPAAMFWDKHPKLQQALLEAVKNQKRPLFLIQPQNDYGLRPSVVLGPEIVKMGKPNRTKIFPAYGRAHAEGNAFAFNAPDIWGKDVLEFIMLCDQVTP